MAGWITRLRFSTADSPHVAAFSRSSAVDIAERHSRLCNCSNSVGLGAVKPCPDIEEADPRLRPAILLTDKCCAAMHVQIIEHNHPAGKRAELAAEFLNSPIAAVERLEPHAFWCS